MSIQTCSGVRTQRIVQAPARGACLGRHGSEPRPAQPTPGGPTLLQIAWVLHHDWRAAGIRAVSAGVDGGGPCRRFAHRPPGAAGSRCACMQGRTLLLAALLVQSRRGHAPAALQGRRPCSPAPLAAQPLPPSPTPLILPLRRRRHLICRRRPARPGRHPSVGQPQPHHR